MHRPGVERVSVPIAREQKQWLRRQFGHTGKSVAAQLAEIVQRELHRLMGSPPRGGAAG